jgi:hypothetical protein
MQSDKSKNKRSFFDRRSGQDRRKAYNIDYFLEGGRERRTSPTGERRNRDNDRRKDWIKISQWSSLHVEGKKSAPAGDSEPLDIE